MGLEDLRRATPPWLRRWIPGIVRRWLPRGGPPGTGPRLGSGDLGATATEDDVRACYRLLLGRAADPEGWRTYEAAIRGGQMPVESLVRHFLTSPEFRARRLGEPEPQSAPAIVDIEGFRIYVPPEDFEVGHALAVDRSYEPHVTAVMRALLSPGKVLVDVGAHVGYFALLAATLVGPRGRVVAFEPSPRSCGLLWASARLNGFAQIDLYPFAAAHERRAWRLVGSGSASAVAGLDLVPGGSLDGPVVVSVTLDEILRDVERVDVVKLDVEGAEHLALLGAAETLRRHRPVLVSEYSEAALASVSGVSGEDYLDLLVRSGYELGVIEASGRVRPCGRETGRVQRALAHAPTSHIDLLARPG